MFCYDLGSKTLECSNKLRKPACKTKGKDKSNCLSIVSKNYKKWYIDSACTDDITGDKNLLRT